MKPICIAALPTVSVNNTVLKIVSHHKYLGVVFDDKLQWSSHIDKVCKSMSYYLYMIGSHRTSLTNSVSKMLVELLVLSRMRYTISTWGPALQQNIFHVYKGCRIEVSGCHVIRRSTIMSPLIVWALGGCQCRIR